MKYFFLLAFLSLLLTTFSCTSDNENTEAYSQEIQKLNIRIKASPDRLMPMLSKSSYAGQIENLLFSSLNSIDTESNSLIPQLSDSVALISSEDSITSFHYTIREEAKWDDGSPITGQDFIFSLKWATNPVTSSSGLASYVSLIDSVIVDPENQKEITVQLNESYILAEEAIGLMPLIPEHFYDPEQVLRKISFNHLKSGKKKEIYEDYITQIENSALGRDSISGSGAYTLESWNTNQSITLKRKNNWWADNVTNTGNMENPALQAFPQEISYLIVPDEVSAITLFKKGDIDVFTNVSPATYKKLKNENPDNYIFYQPAVSSYYYLSLNNKDELLSELHIRKLINSLIDVPTLIETQLNGLAEPTSSALPKGSKYRLESQYESGLNMDNAQKILSENGWEDKDKDGILEKNYNGKLRELSSTVSVSGGQLGQTIALMLKQNAEKVGYEIKIEKKDFSLIRESLIDKSYEMTPLVIKSSSFLYDPYQTWHSDNARAGRPNYSSFSDPVTDSIIDKLRFELKPDSLRNLYEGFQSRILEKQPIIFLASPQELIVTRNDLRLQTSSTYPAYNARLIRKE